MANNMPFNIIDYDMKAGFNANSRILSVDLRMKIGELKGRDIDLMFTHYAGIHSISLAGSNIEVHHRFFSQDSIRLTLPESIDLSKKQTLHFIYSLQIDSVSGSRSCVYSLGRPDKWYPLQYNDLSTHTLTIDLPAEYASLSTGDLTACRQQNRSKTCTWNDKYNFTIPLFIFRSDSLQFVSGNAGKTGLNFYFYTNDTLVQKSFSRIVEASFRYFNNFFGKDYPYRTYSFIEIPDYPAGSATGSLQVFGTTLISDFYTYGRLYSLKPAVHEVAHEWWGIGRIHYKDKTQDKGLQFLRESVNEYLAYMFFEDYWGADSLVKCLETARAYYQGYVNDDNEKLLFDIPQQFTSWEEAVVVYYKGPMIVHQLRMMLGDDKWKQFLGQYYSENKNKYSTYDDFIRVLSLYDKNGEVRKTLYQYLNSKGFREIDQKE